MAMYSDCLACVEAGTEPKRGARISVVYHPSYQRHGTPTISKTKGWGPLSAPDIAKAAYAQGLPQVVKEYKHPREVVLVACWWMGIAGRGKAHAAMKEWAKMAGWHAGPLIARIASRRPP